MRATKLSRKQWQYLQKKFKIDTVGAKLLKETNTDYVIQFTDGHISEYPKETT